MRPFVLILIVEGNNKDHIVSLTNSSANKNNIKLMRRTSTAEENLSKDSIVEKGNKNSTDGSYEGYSNNSGFVQWKLCNLIEIKVSVKVFTKFKRLYKIYLCKQHTNVILTKIMLRINLRNHNIQGAA